MKTFRPMPAHFLLAFAAMLTLNGCGFKPLYAPITSKEGDEISIALELEKSLTARMFAWRLDRNLNIRTNAPHRLKVTFHEVQDPFFIQPDTEARQMRLTLRARVNLRKNGVLLLSRTLTQEGTYNIGDSLYSDEQNLLQTRRALIDQICDDLTTQLLLFLRA